MSFINNLFRTKQDLINEGLKRYLDITQDDKQKILHDFQKANPDISFSIIDGYFKDYKQVYYYSENCLSKLLQQNANGHQNKKTFFETVHNKYNWVDKPNLKKLYDVCSFYLR